MCLVIPGLQPIPSSPRRRAPSSVSSVSIRKASFFAADASTTFPPSKRSRIPSISRPASTAGNSVNAIVPSAESSTGL